MRPWKHDGASTLERELLDAGRALPEVEPDQQAQIWGGLATQLGPPTPSPEAALPEAGSPGPEGAVGLGSGAGSTVASGTAATFTLGELGKLGLIGVVAGVLTGGVALNAPDWLAEKVPETSTSLPHEPRGAQLVPPGPTSTPVAEDKATLPTPPVRTAPLTTPPGLPKPEEPKNEIAPPQQPDSEATPMGSVATFQAPEPATAPASRLAEERRLLAQARTALHSGDTAGALNLLNLSAQKFPRGSLGQEREALTIRALWASGNRGAARARAATFVRDYPGSPHVVPLSRYLRD